jgi:multidrug efflux pump subunit AcrA (membrane-fusion protein)
VLADGQIERVLVLPGDNVRAGQTLALMHSHMVHETEGALTQAYAAVDRQMAAVRFSQGNRDRHQHLLQLQVASQEEAQRADQELKQAQKDLADAQASVHMEREHLSELLQVPPSLLLPGHLYEKELIPIRAVAPGSVLQREVAPGQVLTLGSEAFIVSNLATVWVSAAVNERDLPSVHRGAGAAVTTQGYPDKTFLGKVIVLGDQLDPQTRTVPVSVQVANPGTKLRPGMFATVMIDEPATRNAVFVPEPALQDVNGLRVVFVTADGSTFQVRAVKLGVHSQGLVEVTEGLAAGERIVVDGAFMVKGELLKGSVGEG